MISTIIIDWAGVLTTGKFTFALRDALAAEGLPDISTKDLDGLLKNAEKKNCDAEMFCSWLNDGHDFGITPEKLVHATRSAIIPREDLLAALPDLADEFTLVIGSNNFGFVTPILRAYHAGMLSHFTETFFSNEMGTRKPEPEFFERILEQMGVSPEECLFIDDKKRNVFAAQESGLHAIVFTDVASLMEEIARLR